MERAKPTPQRVRIRRSIDDSLINAGFNLDLQHLAHFRIIKDGDREFRKAHQALVEAGCNPVTLLWALRLGASTKRLSPGAIPSAKRIKKLILSLERLAKEITATEKGGFLKLIVQEETLQLRKEKHLGFEEIDDLGLVLPHLDLERWLRKKSDMYKRWLKLASQKIPPKTSTMLARLEYLFPAVYVRQETGKTCFPQLVTLFDTIGVHVDEARLSRDLKTLTKDYPWLYLHVKTMLHLVKDRTFAFF
jgi:hypothetical protein